MGNVEVSPVSHHIFIPHNTDQYDQIRMGRCQTVAFTADPTGLSCVDLPITSPFTGTAVAAANFTTMAIDSAGRLYVAWEQAPCSPCSFGPQNVTFANILGDTQLYFSTSGDEGNTWSTPARIPTPNLHNDVYAYMAAGDAGRVDIAFYGTGAQAICDPNNLATCHGPDSVRGDWGLYMVQTINAGGGWTAPILASEHLVHRGSIQTLLGAQTGDRTLGDFLQIRTGLQGEANITYGDSNNQDLQFLLAQPMFVRQDGGTTVKSNKPNYCGVAPQVNRVFDPRGDATFNANGLTGPYQPNTDILESDITQPDAQHYQVRMTVQDLTTLTPADPTEGPVLVWSTQWHVPSATDPNGGKLFHAYMESNNGAAPTFWDGENADFVTNGGNGTLTYPGINQITGTYTAGSPAVITINVPVADVSEASPISGTLYSVTASTQAMPTLAENGYIGSGEGGQLFNLVDVAEPYDYIPGGSPVKNQTTCGTAPQPSASGGGGGESSDEDATDDDQGISDTEAELALPSWLLNLVDPTTLTSPLPLPSLIGLP